MSTLFITLFWILWMATFFAYGKMQYARGRLHQHQADMEFMDKIMVRYEELYEELFDEEAKKSWPGSPRKRELS